MGLPFSDILSLRALFLIVYCYLLLSFCPLFCRPLFSWNNCTNRLILLVFSVIISNSSFTLRDFWFPAVDYSEGRSMGSSQPVSKGGKSTLFGPHRKLLRRCKITRLTYSLGFMFSFLKWRETKWMLTGVGMWGFLLCYSWLCGESWNDSVSVTHLMDVRFWHQRPWKCWTYRCAYDKGCQSCTSVLFFSLCHDAIMHLIMLHQHNCSL